MAIPLSVFSYQKKSDHVELLVTNKTIQVDGKSVVVNTIVQPNGTWGYYGTKGDNFNG